ncbi:MAG: hypothetical protein ROO76_21265 [Terriglobia bacterium]|jgi:hypothetical protein|nr:hypothetical protein [Terriglobia bacterium]
MKRHLTFFSAILALLLIPTTFLWAQQAAQTATTGGPVTQDPLVRVLVEKGVITSDEARFIGTGNNQREKLLYLLKQKGVLSNADLDQLTVTPVSTGSQPAATYKPAVLTTTASTPQAAKPTESKPPAPTFIPAVAPLRVLQLEPSKKGLIPDVKLGSGALLKFYGFVKMSVIDDTSSPYGNDFPLPGFIGSIDTGPNPGGEFHVKARSTRLGAMFEWPDLSPNLSITGKVEFDFEGNFSRVNNRNISSMRSSMPSIRLAYGRIDYKTTDRTSVFGLFGQDWTPFGSSTLPNLLETTGLGLGFGTLYERDPQLRVGLFHTFGGDRKFGIGPEFAIVTPSSGLPPTDLASQLGYGERQGPDSARPEIQGRLVFQWQLDKAPGVVPAQFIISAMNGERRIYVAKANVPAAAQSAFPNGTSVSSSQNGVSLEMQLPTRYVTLLAKYYNGEDLRFFFVNGLYSNFTDTTGLTGLLTATGVDGNTVTFGNNGTAYVVAPQRPIRTAGGFVNLGFPLSRIFHADPAGRNAGWQMYLHYSVDDPYARDVRRAPAVADNSMGNRDRSSLFAGTLFWKLNSLVTFGYEQSYYDTKLSGPGAGPTYVTPIWNGGVASSWHDVRSEFSTIFSF